MDWNDCVSLIKSKFYFDVAIEHRYKLCDFRPAFGHIFKEYIDGYDFGGYADSGDTLYGDLRALMLDYILYKDALY